MAAKPAAGAEEKPTSKKTLIIVRVVVLLLAVAGAAGAVLLLKPRPAHAWLQAWPWPGRGTEPAKPPRRTPTRWWSTAW